MERHLSTNWEFPMPFGTTKPYHAEIVRYDVENKTLIAKVKDPGDGPEFLEVTMASDRPTPPSKIQSNKYYGGQINKNMQEHLPVGSSVILEDCRDDGLSADGSTRRVRTMFVTNLSKSSQVLKGNFTIHTKGDPYVRLMDEAAINLGDEKSLADRFTAKEGEDPSVPSGVRFRALLDRGSHYEVVDGTHGFTWMSPALAVLGAGSSKPTPVGKDDVLAMAKDYRDYVKGLIDPDMPEGMLVFEALPYKEISLSKNFSIREFSDVSRDAIDHENLGGVFKSSYQIRRAAHVAVRTGVDPDNPDPKEAGALAVDGVVVTSPRDNHMGHAVEGTHAHRLYASSTPQPVLEKVASHDGKKVVSAPHLRGPFMDPARRLEDARRARRARRNVVSKVGNLSRKNSDPSP